MRAVTLRFCVPCGRRDALHIDGRCALASTHRLLPCAECGRPSTDLLCSACFEARFADLRAATEDAT